MRDSTIVCFPQQLRKQGIMNHSNGYSDFLNGGLIMVGSSSPSKLPFPISSPQSAAGEINCIVHTVTKFDTLAGVAIKYGVEVADIKRLNGLVTDLQMFARKTLQIPLPGRHPPSPILSVDDSQSPRSSELTRSTRRNSDLFDSFQSLKLKSSCELKASPAISSLISQYGLNTLDENPSTEGFEMAVYRNGGDPYPKDGLFAKSSPVSNPPLSLHRKSKSAANELGSVNGHNLRDPLLQESETSDSDRWIMKFMRRRQKSETDFTSRTPEKLLKEESSTSTFISPLTGKGLALRPKSANRTVSGGVDGDLMVLNPISGSSGDRVSTESSKGVRKSSSTPSLQDSDGNPFSSIWPTSKWSLKPDFQALSTAALPIFDGLPKHTGRRNKAALD